MATTRPEIERLLAAGGFRASATAEGAILTGFGEMESYRDTEGLPRLVILISLEEGGSLVRVTCPRLYSYTGVRFKADLFQTCLMLNYWVKLVQLQFDDRDGELRAAVELPIEDAPLTLAQLARCLTDLVHFVDRFDPMLRRTLKSGGVHIPRDAASYQRR